MAARCRARLGFTAVVMLLAAALPAAPDAARTVGAGAEDHVVFTRDIAPVLVQKCLGCHNAQKHKGGYRLDTFEHLLHPGDGEAAPVTPGHPETSEMFRLITSPDEHKRMPQKDDPLPAKQVASIERWIRQGAAFDGTDRSATLPTLIRITHPAAPATYAHPVPAVALAFDPKGATLAVGGYHEITLWEPHAGTLLRRIGNVAQQTHGLAYSPDGTLIAVAGGTPGSLGEVRLFTLADPSTPRVLDRIADVMLCVSFSPDGRRIIAGGADGSVRLYDVASGDRTLLVEQHADWVTAVAFRPDGAAIASASRDKSARVFDASSGDLLSAYPGHEEALFALAWDPDGKRLYTGGRDKQVHAWEPATEAKKVRDFKGFGGDVLRLAVVGDWLFSTSTDGKLRQHNKSTGELVRTTDVTPDYLPGLAVDHGGTTIAAGAFDGSIHLYDAAGEARSTFVASPRP